MLFPFLLFFRGNVYRRQEVENCLSQGLLRDFFAMNGVSEFRLLSTVGTAETTVTHEVVLNAFSIRDVCCVLLGTRGKLLWFKSHMSPLGS